MDNVQKEFDRKTTQIRNAMILAEQQALIASGAKVGLQAKFVRHFTFSRCIYEGNMVAINYAESQEKAIYCGFSSTGAYAWITLRRFTARGKPRKTLDREDCSLMEHIYKAAKP